MTTEQELKIALQKNDVKFVAKVLRTRADEAEKQAASLRNLADKLDETFDE